MTCSIIIPGNAKLYSDYTPGASNKMSEYKEAKKSPAISFSDTAGLLISNYSFLSFFTFQTHPSGFFPAAYDLKTVFIKNGDHFVGTDINNTGNDIYGVVG